MPEPQDGLVDALADYLSDGLDDAYELLADQQPAAFEVTNQVTANRLLRRLARVEARATEAHELAAAEVQKVNAWLEEVTAPLMREREWLVRALEGYARRSFEEDPSRQTFKLPNGTLSLRKATPGVEVHDVEAFRAWAEANADELLQEQKPAPPRAPDKVKARQALRPRGVTIDERTGVWHGSPATVRDGLAWFEAIDEAGEVVPGMYLTRDPSGFTCTVKADPAPTALRVVR